MTFSCSKCLIKKFRESAAESIIDPVAVFYGCRNGSLPQLRSCSCNFPYVILTQYNIFTRKFSIAPHMLIIKGFGVKTRRLSGVEIWNRYRLYQKLVYVILKLLPNLQQKGGELHGRSSSHISCLCFAGVVSCYICKWLDRDN